MGGGPVTNIADRPNHVHLDMGFVGGGRFGRLLSVVPMRHPQAVDQVKIAFQHGLCIELTRADAIALYRQLPGAFNALPADYTGDLSGSAYLPEAL